MRPSRQLTRRDTIVVISATAFLLGNLAAVGTTGRERAKRAVCLANVGQLAQAWLMCAEDNDGRLVGGHTRDDPLQWVGRPQPPVTLQEELYAIERGALFPYVRSVNVYHCPADQRVSEPRPRAFRTYSIPGGANGEEWNGQHVPARNYTDIQDPAIKYVFVEEADPREYNIGSWQMGFQPWRWIDPVAAWHPQRNTLGFADGHSESHQWVNQSTIDRCHTAMYEPTSFSWFMTPPAEEHEDIGYMAAGFPCQSYR